MPLLLLDLDNTLLDRSGAFRAWAREFLAEIGAPPGDVEWLLSIDADGLTDRWDVAEAVLRRYRLRAAAIDLVDALNEGHLEYLRLDPMIACALRIAAESGWVPVIVSNGTTHLQNAKIRRTGLDRYVADWVISEDAGVRKPNPRIFTLAAERVRAGLRGAWVIGESPEADIAGASAAGLPSVWLHRGRRWPESSFAPTRVAENLIPALAAVFAESTGAPRRREDTGAQRRLDPGRDPLRRGDPAVARY